MTQPPEEADRLYGLPLAAFVAERGELAKRLRAEGRRDDAALVAKLPKPSVAAWAANQVLRSQRADARELFAAGDALRAADRTTLREAIERHRAVLGRLLAAGSGLLDENGRGLSAQTLERVQQTLNAASLDPELRAEAEGARLTKERAYSGLGIARAAEEAAADEEAPAAPDQDSAARKREREAQRRRAAERKAAEKRLAKAAVAVRAQEERARAQEDKLRDAKQRLADLREAEAQARSDLDDLGS